MSYRSKLVCTGERAQRRTELGPLAAAVYEFPGSDLRGMSCPHHPLVIVGWGLLPAAAREGQLAPRRRESLLVQLDSRPVRCWQYRTPYNETVYLNVLRKRHSLIIGKLST